MTSTFDPKLDLNRLLDWWTEHMLDAKRGGFFGQCSNTNEVDTEATRGVIMHTRVLWTFSAAARVTKSQRDRKVADHAYGYLRSMFIDQGHGGCIWSVDANGSLVDGKKQLYAQAFALYAFSEYFMLTGDSGAKELSLNLFKLIEQHGRDTDRNGYIEAFANDWSGLGDVRLSTKDLNAEKTMNTHLHVLEAYTNLYRIHANDETAEALRNLIELFLDRFIDPETYHLKLFFDMEWNSLDEIVSYGHDIECSWLLTEAAEVLGDEALLGEVKRVALEIAQVTLAQGTDSDGAVLNERNGDHLDGDKHWWPQAEAAIGYYNAYQLSGHQTFLDATAKVIGFIQNNIYAGDGEWYWRTTRERIVCFEEDKAGPWKAPYHNGRMYLELLHRGAALS